MPTVCPVRWHISVLATNFEPQVSSPELHDIFKPCHPDRDRTTRGSKGEWKDPGTLSYTVTHQGVLTTNLGAQALSPATLNFVPRYTNSFRSPDRQNNLGAEEKCLSLDMPSRAAAQNN
jgi:hypothetical protein